MSFKNWKIEKITTAIAQEMVVKYHYLHRKAPCSIAFGLFDPQGTLKGVILYGTPVSSSLRAGLAGAENTHNVIELTRLWVADDVPKNGESHLIGNTMRKTGKDYLVSFADTSQNHVGTVYQATNWLYTGLSAKRTDWQVEGIDKHGHTWADKYTAQEMRDIFGDKFKLVPRSRKHRYVFVCGKGKSLQEKLAKIKYKIQPYPKVGSQCN